MVSELSASHLTFAIGDIHGELGLLARAVARIEARAGDAPFAVVVLGDYFDRGPDSPGVVRLLRERARPHDLVCLKGNHHQIILTALQTGGAAHWFRNSGETTLRSYSKSIPVEDIEWLRALPVHFSDEHRIYVHGGLKPCVPLEEQEDEVMIWIRDPFLMAFAEELPAHDVHGHTPEWAGKPDAAKPELLTHRTNPDTAAYKTGVLTVGVFETARPCGPIELIYIDRLSTRRVVVCETACDGSSERA
ncbi:MAG: serine/threonine protein phosphatase [Novosphingobium sp.]|nr:serine/threonine protein phosphatase [Novosphingobium sp.]